MIPRTELAAELRDDPAGVGYITPLAAGNHTQLAELLNAPGRSIEVTDVVASAVVAAINWTEFAALYPSGAGLGPTMLQLLLTPGFVKIREPRVRQALGVIFPPTAPTTRAALLALQNRTGSRAEERWGEGAQVSATEIAEALHG